MQDIGALLPQLPNSFGYAVNNTGHVTGAAYNVAYAAPHVFFFNGSAAVDLGTFGGLAATALALNDSDTIAGYFTTTNNLDRAFSYRGGKLTDLGSLGGDYSYARGINNSNLIVGGSFVTARTGLPCVRLAGRCNGGSQHAAGCQWLRLVANGSASGR